MSFVTVIKVICWIGFVLLLPIHASDSANREGEKDDGIRLAIEHDSLPYSDDVDTRGSNENEDLQESIDMMNYLIDELARRERELGEVGEVRKKVVKRAKKQKTGKTGNNSATSGPTSAFVICEDLTIVEPLERCLLEAMPNRRRKRTKRNKATKTSKALKAAKRARRQLADELQQAQAQGFDYTATDELESFIKNFNAGDNQASSDEDDDDHYDDDDDDDNYEIEDLLYDEEEEEEEFKEEDGEEEEFIMEEDFSLIFRELQVDPADYDRAAISKCLKPYQNPAGREIVCSPPPTPAPTERPTLPPTPTPSADTEVCPVRDPLPVCPDIPCTPGEAVQDPCELTNDPSCENCPCECEGEEGKGKGKGYGKGHHNHYGKGKGKGHHYYGKGKGKGHHYYGKGYGKGKSSKKGYKGAKLKGAEIRTGTPFGVEHDALVVKFVTYGICFPSNSPTSVPTEGPTPTPTPPPTPRPTEPPSQTPTAKTTIATPRPTESFPTCPQDDIPECDPDIDCDLGEVVSDRGCPCRCGGGKGKGKGKGGSNHKPTGKGKGYHKPTGKGKGHYYSGKGKGKGSYYSKGKGSYYSKGKGSKGSKSARIKNIKGAKKAKKAAIVVVDGTESSSFSPGDSGAAMLDPEEGAAAMLDPEDGMEETVARPRRRRRRKTVQEGGRDEENEATILMRYLQQAYDEETEEGLSELVEDPNHVL